MRGGVWRWVLKTGLSPLFRPTLCDYQDHRAQCLPSLVYLCVCSSARYVCMPACVCVCVILLREVAET